jgi:hypothetical protein
MRDRKEYQKEYRKQWRLENKEYHKQYYLENKEFLLEKQKKYLLDNKEKRKQYNLNNKEKFKQYNLNNKEKIKQYYLDNKEKILEQKKQYRINNKEKTNKYIKKRRQEDSLFKLSCNLRVRIRDSIKSKGWTKQNKTADILGCDYETVKKHLENQFIDNMSWDNHGRWHIDHITPLAKATTQEELYKLCHYTNLQPLWAADNLSKGAKEL